MGPEVPASRKFGPLWLAPGVTPRHVITKFYAGFITIGMLTGMAFMQGYVLTEHLHIPRGQQGGITGDLAFWTEIVGLLLINPFGILSDRIGRRPIMIFGMLVMGIGYGLYPFATTVNELLVYRLIQGVGAAACATMISSLANDYPAERSRGKMIAFGSIMSVLGVLFIAMGLSQLPALLIPRGFTPLAAGKIMFVTAAVVCLISAVVFRFGLKSGTAMARRERAPFRVLVTSGTRAARNPRIALAYAAAFCGRADVAVKGMFLSLWAIHDGPAWGLSPGMAMARFGFVLFFMQVISVVWLLFFGWLADRISRVTIVTIAMVLGACGYLSMGLITSPLDYAMMPAFALLTMGSSSVNMASLGLVGQEAPVQERGAVIGMFGLWAALGILIFSKAGGMWYDEWGPWGPFMMIGAVQLVVLVASIFVRVLAPGSAPIGRLQPAHESTGSRAP